MTSSIEDLELIIKKALQTINDCELFELSKKSSQVLIIGEFFKDFVSNLPFSQYLNSNGEN